MILVEHVNFNDGVQKVVAAEASSHPVNLIDAKCVKPHLPLGTALLLAPNEATALDASYGR